MDRSFVVAYEKGQKCSVTIGRWQEVAEKCGTFLRTIAIVDEAVAYNSDIHELFSEVVVVRGGEPIKNIESAAELWQMLSDVGADRQSVLVGIGGGTVTDLVGFVASTYMRGIRCVLLPTTLLAQVDAAIGGKCGVNLGGLKNMVGTFSLPMEVVCDPEWLRSLPEREWRAGMAEVIKTAIIGDAELFDVLENTTLEEVRADAELCGEIVARAVAVKVGIVSLDLLESGQRRLLNLGHTLAHAIESLTDEHNHGEAVAIGISYVCRRAVERGICSEHTAERIVALLERYGLPTSHRLDEEALQEAVRHDKKGVGGEILWVVPTEIGACKTESCKWL